MTIHAVIPDLHADLDRLEASLAAVPAGARVLFLGDFIDAAPEAPAPADKAVLARVRGLLDAGHAQAVMGNHELDAILFHTPDATGAPLLPDAEDHRRKHQAFIDTFGMATPEARRWTDWFLAALPLWREVGGLRLAHACWSAPDVALIRRRRPDGLLQAADLAEIAQGSTPFGRAVRTLVSGPKVRLPACATVRGTDGQERDTVQIAWWNAGAATWPEAVLDVPDPGQLPRGPLPPEVAAAIYDPAAPPVLVGHYKRPGAPRLAHPKASSLDYPHQPCLYMWSGEDRLRPDRLCPVA